MMMRKTLVGLTAASMLVAGPAFASTKVEDELAEMRELVEGLKDRVEAQEEQLEHQGQQLESAQRVVREVQDDGTLSGVSEFWGAIDVNMSAAASYAYNFANPDTAPTLPGAGVNGGAVGLYPFHGDHNSFQVDQVWLDIGKEATEESRAGFMFTMLFGNTAAFLGQGGNLGGGVATVVPTDIDGDGIADINLSGPAGTPATITVTSNSLSRRNFLDSASDYYVHQAYVSYLAPIGPEGFEVTAGKFATLIGAEVADASANWNITRGNVYQLFQPIDHTGVLGSTSFGPVTIKGGVVNAGNLTNGSPDFNKEKSYLGSIGLGNDMVGLTTTVLYGAEGGLGVHPLAVAGDNSRREGVVDVLATLTTDGFEAWVNADYVWAEDSSTAGYGVAVAGMVPLGELLYVAARLEYARDEGNVPLIGFRAPRHTDIYSATGTLAYELAENLTLKGEVRYDKVNASNGPAPGAFVTNTASGSSDQVVGLGQMVYAF